MTNSNQPLQSDKALLHVIDTTGPGGAETVFIQLALLSRQSGYRVLAVVRGMGWVHDQLQSHGIETLILPCKGSFNLPYLIALIRLIRKRKISAVQSHLLGSNVYTSFAGLLTKTPVVSTFHGHVDISPNERLRWLKMLLVRLGSHRIVAVTKPLQKAISQLGGGLLRSKLQVIANGVPLQGFPEQVTSKAWNETIEIGCLGNIRPAKNYALALQLVRHLIDIGIQLHLNIAGDDSNSLAAQLKKEASAMGLDDSVRFIGFIDDVPGFLAGQDVFLMTSSSEGHPLALTQALAAGLPIVTTPSGVETVVSDNILFVSEGHCVETLSQAFLRCLQTSSSELELRVNSGMELAIQQFSVKAMFTNYKALYEQVIG